ncbi:diguanylate cyclase [Yoonia sp. F2084L]|uniref:diguanylate cyclase domain-containing protein n=1 Tax=Yoonia sp. F2084L TaxID=2926419 RepID=UPI001FF628D2|nr:diguanylate cyclase [Yoonia sp. F2084L]MCK0094925.1 diguanylate cyclase [Yoonia sp. F2084L]
MNIERHVASDGQDDAHRLAWRIFLTSVANGLTAIVVIIGVAIWMANHANMQARSTTAAQLEAALQAELDSVAISTQDYAHWDYAHTLVTNRSTADFYENFGSGATESTTFDFIYVLDGDGTPLYAYETGGSASDLSVYDHRLSAPFYAAVVDSPVVPYFTKTGFALNGDRFAAVAAVRIQPDEPASDGLTDFPVMIAGNWITPTRLATLGRKFFVTDITLDTATSAATAEQSTLLFNDITGQSIASLHWTPDRPGQRLLNTALPVILALCLLTLVSNLVVGRASSRQTRALLDQQQLARTDRLTGLINRAGLDTLISLPTYREAIATGRIAAIYLDLNGFKQLNDSQGHDVGDLALQVFAERVRGTLRAQDAIVRIGGDEFVCILRDENPCQTAETIAWRIIKATTPPVRIGDRAHKITPSIGVAIGAEGICWPELQKNADRAMYRAKVSGIAEPVFYAKDTNNTQPLFTAVTG